MNIQTSQEEVNISEALANGNMEKVSNVCVAFLLLNIECQVTLSPFCVSLYKNVILVISYLISLGTNLVVVLYKAYICCSSIAGITFSNPAGMDIYLLCLLCRQTLLRRARGVLPSACVRACVRVRAQVRNK